MSLKKKIFRHPSIRKSLAWIAAQYIHFIFKTCRWHFVGKEHIQPYWDHKIPLITAFWHGRMLLMPKAWMSSHPFSMLISSHPDGQMIAQVIQYHGLKTVAGSTSKGGLEALRQILACLKNKGSIGITPDGPRGPRYQVSDGVITISRLSGVDILPCTYATERAIIVNSWDRFRIPLPFGRAVFIWGKPLKAPDKKSSPEELKTLRQELQGTLNKLSLEAERLCQFKGQERDFS